MLTDDPLYKLILYLWVQYRYKASLIIYPTLNKEADFIVAVPLNEKILLIKFKAVNLIEVASVHGIETLYIQVEHVIYNTVRKYNQGF